MVELLIHNTYFYWTDLLCLVYCIFVSGEQHGQELSFKLKYTAFIDQVSLRIVAQE